MQYSFVHVKTNNDKFVLTEDGRIVVLSATPLGGGGGSSLNELDKVLKTPLTLSYKVIGIKKFKCEFKYSFIGTFKNVLFEKVEIVGLKKDEEIQLICNIFGITKNDIKNSIEIKGEKFISITDKFDTKGTKKTIASNTFDLLGKIQTILTKNLELLGNKQNKTKITLNLKGKKLNKLKKEFKVFGKKDIMKIINFLLQNIDEE